MFKSKMIEQQTDFFCAHNHNLPIMSVILNQQELNLTNRLLCSECIENIDQSSLELIGFKKAIQLIDDQQSQKMKFIENFLETNIQEVDRFLNQVSEFKSQVVQSLEYLNSMSMQYILSLKQIGIEYSNYSFSSGLNFLINKEKSALDYGQLMKDINKIFNIWYQKANPKLQQFKSFEGYTKCQEILDYYLELHQKQQAPTKGANFKFVQIQNNTQIFQEEWCGAVAINNDNSIVAAGCKKDIKIFEFKQGIMKCVQLLKEHKNDVNTLFFLKKTQPQQLISGGDDDIIIIWSSTIPWYTNILKWSCHQKLIGHTSYIWCLIVNNIEDLIISGSRDKTIKFWDKKKSQNQQLWECSQTISHHTNWVYSLSLSSSQKKLISCSEDCQILIIQQQLSLEWCVIQVIQVEIEGVRLCFINDTIFTVQPYEGKYMQIYELNEQDQYIKTRDLAVKGDNEVCRAFFPQQYISQKKLLINKNGYHINLICYDNSGEFIIVQSINFGEVPYGQLYGTLSDNGQYIITWDRKSKEFQIREFQFT
ncbi:unnamed protein product [Paramecium sonneborni]|uniref:Uncharacterized protein n=1 Tax=Paramecium sonneborni TaxID=65129 RepID=A0A8S1KNG6_9CILI|nr:unnamed protein product [Paramecium sonneborni]